MVWKKRMNLRLRNIRDVRAFSIAVTAVALIGNLALQSLLMPAELFGPLRISGAIITLSLAAPISFFVGLRMYDIHRLTLEFEQAAAHDPLTGAATRARFYERAAEAGNWRTTVIAADIDHFKAFNDRFGHQAGDMALRQVATTLMRNCRDGDVVARFGGEEFLILLPGTGLQDGLRVAERLRDALRRSTVSAGGDHATVTASFGVAEVDDPQAIDDAIDRADTALYAAKRAGRDRVHRAG